VEKRREEKRREEKRREEKRREDNLYYVQYLLLLIFKLSFFAANKLNHVGPCLASLMNLRN